MNEKLRDLVHLLRQRTSEGRLAWQSLDTASHEFMVQLGQYSVSIHQEMRRHAEAKASYTATILLIYNQHNKVVEQLDVDDLGGVDGIELAENLDRLYDLVRRQVLGIDTAVDAIIDQLRTVPAG